MSPQSRRVLIKAVPPTVPRDAGTVLYRVYIYIYIEPVIRTCVRRKSADPFLEETTLRLLQQQYFGVSIALGYIIIIIIIVVPFWWKLIEIHPSRRVQRSGRNPLTGRVIEPRLRFEISFRMLIVRGHRFTSTRLRGYTQVNSIELSYPRYLHRIKLTRWLNYATRYKLADYIEQYIYYCLHRRKVKLRLQSVRFCALDASLTKSFAIFFKG